MYGDHSMTAKNGVLTECHHHSLMIKLKCGYLNQLQQQSIEMPTFCERNRGIQTEFLTVGRMPEKQWM